MDHAYNGAYKALNQAQARAVDTIEGPLLVVAGPGTGKTQLLSLRVANILRQTDTDPASILCLTFTNLAATNMRERLNSLVGSAAHSVVVKTFHAFAGEIMNLYPEYFWNGARLRLVPDAVQLDIIENLLTKLPLDNPLAIKFADNFTAVNDILSALKLAKEAGLTPQKLTTILKQNESYIDKIEPKMVKLLSPKLSYPKLDSLLEAVEKLPDQKSSDLSAPLLSLSTILKSSLARAVEADHELKKATLTGKWKRQWLQTVKGQPGLFDERRRHKWWLAFSEVYSSYRQELHRRGYYDYSDMIVEVISQLEQQSELLASVQERFLYVLIDEFQDTNAAQLRLAHLVASHPINEGRPNLMVVGDDDQSIFAFNGAELNNMLNFRRTYKDVTTIVLTDNYRSTQAILDSAQSIIDQADDRLVRRVKELNKNLIAVSTPPKGVVEHQSFPTKEYQLLAIVERLKNDWQTNPNQSLAVLARSHDSLVQLSAHLSQAGLPIRYEQQNNVLELPLIEQISLLAELIVGINEGDQKTVNFHLSRLLAHPAWQVPPKTLWQIAKLNFNRDSDWLDSLAKTNNKQLISIANWLQWLAGEAATQPLSVMIEYLVGLRAGGHLTSPLRQYYLSYRPLSSEYLESLSGLSVVFNLTREFIGEVNTSPRLVDFTRFLRLNRTMSRPIVNESWFVSGENAIMLLTVHKAKGLEFDSVYLIDAVESEWQPRRIGRKPPANLPLQPYGEHFDDYARLAYVAATRARRNLIISSYSTDSKGQPILASPLFSALPLTQSEPKLKTKEIKLAALETSLSWPRLASSDQKALLSERLENFSLSATGFAQFLNVAGGGPQHFLERQLLRLPELTTDYMAYGTAMHSALQEAQRLVNQGTFSLKAVLGSYQTALYDLQLPNTSLERFISHGQNILKRLFSELDFALPLGGLAEIKFNHVSSGGIPINGTFDHLVKEANSLVISDYKTGTPLKNFATKAQNKALKAWRHRNQLMFYCLLASSSGRYRNSAKVTAQVVYLEAETKAELSLPLVSDDEEMIRFEALLNIVWQHILQLNFPDVSAYPPTIEGIKAFEDDLLSGKIKLPASKKQAVLTA